MKTATLLASSALALVAVPALAVSPQVWVQAGAGDFTAGEGATVAIDRTGSLTLAPSTDLLFESPEPRIWSVASSPRGDIYVAAGERGKVLRIGGPGEEPTTIFAAKEIGAQALAWGPDGNLYVAAGPRGGIYRVPADHDGSSLQPWYEPDAVYVWDLLFGPDGTLYVATGGDGKILAVDPQGNAEVLYDSPEPHVTCLAMDDQGNLLAGTEGNGYVYRISPAGDVFVLYDAPVQEITDLLVADGRIWAAGFGSESGDASGGDDDDAARASHGGGNQASGAVFRIDPDGYASRVWASDDAGVYSLGQLEGDIVAGTGDDGRLVRVGPTGQAGRVGKLGGAQVVALDPLPDGGLLAATSNVGRLYTLHGGFGEHGEFVSSVKDTGTTSRWGALRWFASVPAGASLSLSTRTGNTAVPDDTWSDWSAEQMDDADAVVASPPARFVQWRARLSTDGPRVTPVLHRVELAFVTRNLPPVVASVTAHPAGVVYRQTAGFDDGMPFAQLPEPVARALRESDANAAAVTQSRAFTGRPFYIAGLQTFSWDASDPNGDEIVYTLEFRDEAEETWKPLAGPLSDSVFVLDTRRLPDGTYVARVVASDSPSNTPEEALSDSEVSRAFHVDNTPPRIDGLTATVGDGAVTVRGSVRDATSLVRGLQYSVDGAEWRTVLPADGVADTPAEDLEIEIGSLAAGEHVLVVRATDSALNEGAAKVSFTVR